MENNNDNTYDAYVIHWADQKIQLEKAAEALETNRLIVQGSIFDGEHRADLMRCSAESLRKIAATLETLAKREESLR